MKPVIALSQRIIDEAMAMLEGRAEILIPEAPGQEAFEEILPRAQCVILRTNVKMTARAIANAPELKIICRTGAGIDNVDAAACRERGILLTNAPTANSISVAEHAVALSLSLAKRLPVYDSATRSGGWAIRTSYRSRELSGKIVGIVGLGRIGRMAAEMFRCGFHMNVVGYDPFVPPEACPDYRVTKDPREVFAAADVVSIHCPSTPDTVGMVNAEMLSLARPGLILVNCARGDVVVMDDLIAALRSGQVAAAGLDVFPTEPIDPASPLIGMDNVILTPHTAGLTAESARRLATQAVEQALKYFAGEPLDFQVKL